jgi:conjugal transfer pilus assembly protein TraF
MVKVGLLLIALFINVQCFAESIEDNYYDQHAKGWHWYDDPEPKAKVKPMPSNDPVEQMNAIRSAIQRSMAKAIIDPTKENVETYIATQNAMSNRANQFANTWQQVLLEHPELDYSLIHPTNAMATQIYYGEQHKAQEAAIEKLSQESGLFFFYKSTCPYCQKFAPVVKAFAERYHMTVIPITMDGISLPEFPHSLIDRGQSLKFNVQVEPSLFAVNPYTHRAYPIAYGLVSEDYLRQRILDIAKNFRGES